MVNSMTSTHFSFLKKKIIGYETVLCCVIALSCPMSTPPFWSHFQLLNDKMLYAHYTTYSNFGISFNQSQKHGRHTNL